MQADSPALLRVRKTAATLQKAFHPVELPSVKLAKPSWLILQSLDDKSTSLLLAQRKQALHTNATSSALLWWSRAGSSPGAAGWRATAKRKNGKRRASRLFCGFELIKTFCREPGSEKHTWRCKCVLNTSWTHTHLGVQSQTLLLTGCELVFHLFQCVSALLLFRNNYLRCGGDHQTGPGHRHTPPPPSHTLQMGKIIPPPIYTGEMRPRPHLQGTT